MAEMNRSEQLAMSLTKKQIKSIILDVNGVLYESGESVPIEGSVDAYERLAKKFRVCLVTNHCTSPRRVLANKLQSMGFGACRVDDIVSPAPVACEYLLSRAGELRPKFLVARELLDDFEPILSSKLQVFADGKHKPNCLVVGNAKQEITRNYLDDALVEMLQSNNNEQVHILSLGASRYYRDAGRLRLGTGSYCAAFEFALGTKAVNCGKPAPRLFQLAMSKLESEAQNCVMIGDDLVSDIGGAQAVGMKAILLKTGKYEQNDEIRNANIKADKIFDNLSEAANFLCSTI